MLCPQVLGDEAIVSGELVEGRWSLRRLQRERSEIEPRRPAFGAFVQSPRLLLRDVHAGLREQRPGLGICEGELRGADLEQVASRTEACERERRLAATGQHEQRPARDVQRKCVHGVERLGIRERVDVVEDEDRRDTQRRDRRPEARDRGRPERVSSRRNPTEHAPVERLDGVQRRRDIAEEHDGVVVGLVEGDPGERPGVFGSPLREERRLAVPRGCDHADEARLVPAPESRDERRPAHRAPSLRRNCELGRAEIEGGSRRRPVCDGPPRACRGRPVLTRGLAIDALYQAPSPRGEPFRVQGSDRPSRSASA